MGGARHAPERLDYTLLRGGQKSRAARLREGCAHPSLQRPNLILKGLEPLQELQGSVPEVLPCPLQPGQEQAIHVQHLQKQLKYSKRSYKLSITLTHSILNGAINTNSINQKSHQ